MTLIISIVGPSWAIQAADTQLTKNGVDWDNQSKMIVVHAKEAVLVLSYAGAAFDRVGARPLDECLVEVVTGHPYKGGSLHVHRPLHLYIERITNDILRWMDTEFRVPEGSAYQAKVMPRVSYVMMRWKSHGQRYRPSYGMTEYDPKRRRYVEYRAHRYWFVSKPLAIVPFPSGIVDKQKVLDSIAGALCLAEVATALGVVFSSAADTYPEISADYLTVTVTSPLQRRVEVEYHASEDNSTDFNTKLVPWIVSSHSIVAPSQYYGPGPVFSRGKYDVMFPPGPAHPSGYLSSWSSRDGPEGGQRRRP